jgi:hypothetical protein
MTTVILLVVVSAECCKNENAPNSYDAFLPRPLSQHVSPVAFLTWDACTREQKAEPIFEFASLTWPTCVGIFLAEFPRNRWS